MRKPETPRICKIGLLLFEKTEYTRGVLGGIADFAKDHPSYRFQLAAPDRAGVEQLVDWRPDGLIVSLNQKSLVSRLLSLNKPMVQVCKLPGEIDSLRVQSDDTAVGRLGAEHLLECKAATYAFVGLSVGEFVEVRAKAFSDTIAKLGHSCAVFRPLGQPAIKANLRALLRWLHKCPKPLAVMTSNDQCGRLVLETCKNAGWQIPDEVAVLGVDNEDPLSRLIWPGLSSITLDTNQIGHRAAALLHRALMGSTPSKPSVFLSPLGVVARGSTRPLALEDPILAKALSAIHDSASHSFSVKDLLKVVPISRVSLERRFRRLINRTPLQEIRRVHISLARQLLMATDLPLGAIAKRCGYANSSRLIESFQRETGSTPANYRRHIDRRRKSAITA